MKYYRNLMVYFVLINNSYGYKWTWVNKSSSNKTTKTIIFCEIGHNIWFKWTKLFNTIILPHWKFSPESAPEVDSQKCKTLVLFFLYQLGHEKNNIWSQYVCSFHELLDSLIVALHLFVLDAFHSVTSLACCVTSRNILNFTWWEGNNCLFLWAPRDFVLHRAQTHNS